MRKLLALAAALSVLSVVGLGVLHVQINAFRDQISVTETTLYGDPKAAQGLTAVLKSNLAGHLHWDTTQTFGESPVTRTRFHFTNTRAPGREKEDHYGLRTEYIGGFLQNLDLDTRPEGGMELAVWELLQQVQPGQEQEISFRLADYTDFYPLDMTLDLPGQYMTFEHDNIPQEREFRRAMEAYWKIPVLPEEWWTMSVGKDQGGGLSFVGWSSEEGDFYSMNIFNAVAQDACYFLVDNRSEAGTIMDFSQVPGGYGVHILPFRMEPAQYGEAAMPKLEGMSMVYPMEESSQCLWMELDPEGARLLLLTREEAGGCLLRVIGLPSMETLQALPLGEMAPEDWANTEDYLAFLGSGHRLTVLEREEGGLYRLACTTAGAQEVAGELEYREVTGMATAWDGERFACLKQYWGGYMLELWDGTGLRYLGHYDIDQAQVMWDWGDSAQLDFDLPSRK